MQVFNSFVNGSSMELLDENVRLFNDATRGGLTLTTESASGDYKDVAKYARINNLVRRRNAYGNSAVSEVDVSQINERTVKVAAGTAPARIDPHLMTWIAKDPREIGVIVGRQVAEGRLKDMVDVAVGALAVSLASETTNYYDGKTATCDLATLNKGAAKFGDRSSDIVCWLLNSKPAYDLLGSNITNSNRLFEFGTVSVMADIAGRPIVMTDVDALVNPDGIVSGTDSYYGIGLAAGGAMVKDNGDYVSNIDTSNGKDNIVSTMQSQWSYNLGLKGFAWDSANGGASPTTAALHTATNWDKVATSHKDLGGVVIETQ